MNGERLIVDLATFTLPENPIDCFRSIFLSSSQLDYHVGRYGSLDGYNGAYTVDWLPVSFKHDNIDLALKESRLFLSYLEASHDIDPSNLRITFSGFNEFHILLPSELFGYITPATQIPKIFRYVIQELCQGLQGIDYDVYQHTSLIRFVNSKVSSTGLFKILLSFHELFNRTVDELEEMAKQPRTPKHLVPKSDVRANKELQSLYDVYRHIMIRE